MAVNREEIYWTYKILLGREPESEVVYKIHSQAENVRALYHSITGSDEFQKAEMNLATENMGHDFFTRNVIVFLHLPKCAGTTLHNLLVQNFGPNFPERFNGLYNWPPSVTSKYRLFSGHFDIPSVGLIAGTKKCVTILREPKARLLSAYRFLKSHKDSTAHFERQNKGNNLELVSMARMLTAEDFFNHPNLANHPSINNTYVRTFSGALGLKNWMSVDATNQSASYPVSVAPDAALRNAIRTLRCDFSAFGVVEHMDASINHIFSKLGLGKPSALPVDNSLDRRVSEGDLLLEASAKVELTASLSVALEKHINLDRVLYEAALGDLRKLNVIKSKSPWWKPTFGISK